MVEVSRHRRRAKPCVPGAFCPCPDTSTCHHRSDQDWMTVVGRNCSTVEPSSQPRHSPTTSINAQPSPREDALAQRAIIFGVRLIDLPIHCDSFERAAAIASQLEKRDARGQVLSARTAYGMALEQAASSQPVERPVGRQGDPGCWAGRGCHHRTDCHQPAEPGPSHWEPR